MFWVALSVCLPTCLSPHPFYTLLLLWFFSPCPTRPKFFFKEITFGNWNFYVFSYLANVCSITSWGENAFSSLRCSVLLPKRIVFRLYVNHSHKDHVWSHLPSLWCLPIFGKFITISKLPKVLINNSSGDFYSSLLKGHRGVFWYFGQKAAAWLVALEQEHGIEQPGLCVHCACWGTHPFVVLSHDVRVPFYICISWKCSVKHFVFFSFECYWSNIILVSFPFFECIKCHLFYPSPSLLWNENA